jgi:hypothetical protein
MTILCILYAVSVLLLARPVAGHIAWSISDHFNQKRPDGLDWTTGALFGIFWPTVAAIYAGILVARVSMKAFYAGTSMLPAKTIGAEARAQHRLRQQSIKNLEKSTLDRTADDW